MMKIFFFILVAIGVLLFCGYADIAIRENEDEEERKKRAVVRKAAVASQSHPVDFEEFLRSISE